MIFIDAHDQVQPQIRPIQHKVKGGILFFLIEDTLEERYLATPFVPIESCRSEILEDHYWIPKEHAEYLEQVVGDCNFPDEVWMCICEKTPLGKNLSLLKALFSKSMSGG